MSKSKGEWVRKSGLTTERRTNTTNGNPRFWVTFSDGTRFATANDASVGFVIENSEYRGDVLVYIEGGVIKDIDVYNANIEADNAS